MRIALINASPKTNQSASGILMEDLKKCILFRSPEKLKEVESFEIRENSLHDSMVQKQLKEVESVEIKEIGLHDSVVQKEAIEEMKNAEVWVFAFPLYVDGIPSHLLSNLIQLDKLEWQEYKKYVYSIVNCGFYEGIQTEYALNIMQNWCIKTGLHWCGGIGVGGGGSLIQLPDVKNGHGPKAPVLKALNEMADTILQHRVQENQYVSVAFPRFLYKMAAQIGWRQMIRANGGKIKDLGKGGSMETSMEKSKGKRKWWKAALLIVILALSIFIVGAGAMFREELKIAGSVHPLTANQNVYYMEVDSDYYFDEFLEAGGASSDAEVSAFLTNRISHGFYQVEVANDGPACSVLSALDSGNNHVWGRNFDWDNSVPILVKCEPEDGYASISTCDFKNVTDSLTVPDNFVTKMLAIAALYVPMDGVNEAGLCVADLEVNEGGMMEVDTNKPDLTVTTAIRLLLNQAATVEDAVKLLGQYDIHASGGISHHLAISDASGASVSVEFVDGEMVVVNTSCITNFNLANGDTAAGGDSAKERYEQLCAAYEEKSGILTHEDVKTAMMCVSKTTGEWKTQWSIVYRQDLQTLDYYFGAAYEDKITIKPFLNTP